MVRIRVNLDEVPDYVSMEAGRTRAKLRETTEDVSKQGNDMITWLWEGLEGVNEGRTIKSYTSLLEDALGNLKNHLAAFGITGDIDVDTKKLHGKSAILIITSRKVRDKETGEERTLSSVSNVLPDKGGKPVSKPVVSTSSSSKRGKKSEEDSDIPF